MMTLRYVVILIVVSTTLLTLHYISRTANITSYSPSLAFEVTTPHSSSLARSAPWLCDCFHYGSPIPQLVRDTPVPPLDPIEDGDDLPLIEPTILAFPNDDIIHVINSNLHWPRTLIITVANYGIRHHVYSWIRSLENTHEERYVIACLDRRLYDHLYKAGYGNHAFVIPDDWMHYSTSSDHVHYPSHDYRLIGFTKTLIIQHILHLDISALYSDVDVVWNRPRTRDYIRALMDVRGGNTHALFSQNDLQQHQINTGFFLMRPTPFMKRIIADTIYIQEQREQAYWENNNTEPTTQQMAMNEALSKMNLQVRTSRIVLLDVFLFQNGYAYFYEKLHEKLNIDPYIIHANYLIGEEKVAKLKENGLWYLDEAWLSSIDNALS